MTNERKIPDVELELEAIRDKLNFFGLCLTSNDAMDGIPDAALSGAGAVLLEMAKAVEAITSTLYPIQEEVKEEKTQGEKEMAEEKKK